LTAIQIFSGVNVKDPADNSKIKNISAQEAKELVDNNIDNPHFALIDVRTPKEYAQGRIDGAINMNFNSTAFGGEVEKLNKANIYLVYCQRGHRSRQAMKIMESLGFKEIYNLSGGLNEWITRGLPVVKT
jgi:rhodanese-related sulfurtransferase